MDDPLSAVPVVSPQFALHWHVDGSAFLIGEHQRLTFAEPIFARLLRSADGVRTGIELIDTLASEFAEHEVLFALQELLRTGGLVDATLRGTVLPESLRAFGIESADGTELGELEAALQGAGLVVNEDAPLRLLLTRDFLEPRLGRRIRELLARGVSVIPLKPTGDNVWLGPLLEGGAPGPCWDCLRARLERNRPVELFLHRAAPAQSFPLPPSQSHGLARPAAASFAASVLGAACADPARRSELRETLFTLALPGFHVQQHRVVQRPQCERCGDPELERRSMSAPVGIGPALRIDAAGGYRTRPSDETFSRCAHLISPITGVIASFGPVQRADHPMRPVFGASYYVCPAPGAPREPGDPFSRPAFGKGRTPAQSRTSALAEAIERYAALWTGSEPTVRATARELGDDAVPPQRLLNFSARQYAERSAASRADWRHSAPALFSETLPLDWTPCWSLTRECRRYVPTSYVINQFPAPEAERVCPFNPNGGAAGNGLEEAILQGFLELVERDAVAIWWYNRLHVPGVALESFTSDYGLRVQQHYAGLGWELAVLDVTQDLDVPTFAAIARQRLSGRFLVGFGCHFDAELALERAVTELHQCFDTGADGPAAWTLCELEDARFVQADPGQEPRRAAQLPRAAQADIGEEVRHGVRLARDRGLETLVFDYSRADLELKTVKVIVPGLRHVWRRLGPGRLYDVPVKRGLRAEPLLESALNPLTLRV